MKSKIIRFTAVAAFTAASLLLLGSMPVQPVNSANHSNNELQKVNNSFKNAVNEDFFELQQKNPLILLEFAVE